MNASLSLRLGHYECSLEYDHRGNKERPTQHLRHAILLLRKASNSVQNNKVSSPLPIFRIHPTGIDTQSGLPLRPRRHLIGRWFWFLLLGIHSGESIITIPVRTDVGRDNASRGVETTSDEDPIVAISLNKALQELVVLRRPKLISDTRLLHTLGIVGRRSNNEMVVIASLE